MQRNRLRACRPARTTRESHPTTHILHRWPRPVHLPFTCGQCNQHGAGERPHIRPPRYLVSQPGQLPSLWATLRVPAFNLETVAFYSCLCKITSAFHRVSPTTSHQLTSTFTFPTQSRKHRVTRSILAHSTLFMFLLMSPKPLDKYVLLFEVEIICIILDKQSCPFYVV